MKANELRVGNWVQKNQKQYRCISDTIVLFDNGEIELKPIPLTEEWLLRFGFEKDGVGWYFLQIEDHVTKVGYCYNVISKIFEINEMEINGIQYVHQLQNLYFALTGQELTIKEAER